MRALLFFTGLLAVRGIAIAAETPPAVTVEVHPPVITRQQFPKGKPPFTPNAGALEELGWCATRFGCSVELRTESPRLALTQTTATVVGVDLGPRIQIDIWTQERSKADVASHEETHREIAEHYYGAAQSVAREIGQSTLGRKFNLPARATDKTFHLAVRAIEQAIVNTFMARTSRRCQFAQERFDAITDHGRNKVANDDAKAQALAEEAVHWEKVKNDPPALEADVVSIGWWRIPFSPAKDLMPQE